MKAEKCCYGLWGFWGEIWALPAVIPFFLILFSYFSQAWSWGLMDDLQLLTMSGDLWERAVAAFRMYLAFGELKPVFSAHSAFFYQVFSGSPRLFHMFKFFEIVLMLGLWGRAAVVVTGERLAFWLVLGIALSFHYLYDQFFFLSTHEALGLLFAGAGINVLASIVRGGCGRQLWYRWIWLVLALAGALGSKETMVAAGIAAGVSLVLRRLVDGSSRRGLFWSGIFLTAGMLVYAFVLKFAISSAYTAKYSFTNFPVLADNFSGWVKKDFLCHVPWLTGALFLCWKDRREILEKSNDGLRRWGLVLGLLLYTGHLLILLPWNTTSYYAAPLGVYFAFTIAVLIAARVARLEWQPAVMMVTGAVVLNLFVASFTLNREKTYHLDTQNLWAMIRGNDEFCRAARNGLVATNGMEAGEAIPGHANRWWGLGLKAFRYYGEMRTARQETGEYFVHSPRFGDLSPDTSGWKTVFYSQFWQVYQKESK